MQKVPVGDTIAFAYRFGFGEFLTLLRLSWIPLTIMMVPSLFISYSLPQGATGIAAPNQFSLGYGQIASFIAVFVLQLICSAIAVVAYTEHALHPSPDRKFFYLPSAKVVGKVLAAWLLTSLAFGAFFISASGIIYIAQLAGKTSSGMERPGGGFISTLVTLSVMGAAFYVFLRATFILTPLVVAEGKIDLRRAWDLGRGNFWRYVAIALGIALPLLIASFAASLLFANLIALPQSALDSAQSAAERQQMITDWNATVGAQLRMLWPLMAIINIGIYIVMYGISAGASVFAYRALVPANAAPESDA